MIFFINKNLLLFSFEKDIFKNKNIFRKCIYIILIKYIIIKYIIIKYIIIKNMIIKIFDF